MKLCCMQLHRAEEHFPLNKWKLSSERAKFEMSQLKDDQHAPASLMSSASIASLQTFKHPSRAARDLSPRDHHGDSVLKQQDSALGI